MKKNNNLKSISHICIITMILLSISGCGYKAAPYYEEESVTTVVSDENVEIKIKKTDEIK